MTSKGMHLAWIVVKDFEKAKKFYQDVVGLKLLSENDEFGWAEFGGEDGAAMVGIAKDCDFSPIKAGQNAVMTFTVDDIEVATKEVSKKGVELVGELQVIPDHVKLQLFKDPDGNICQLVETCYSK